MQEPAIQKQVFEWLVLTIIGACWPRPLTFVIPLGFEPKTHSLEGCCSIQLSYGTVRLTVRGARPRGKGLQIYDFSLNLHHFLLSLHGIMKITEAIFAGSSTRVDQRPKERLPEVAFIGRSNVGKSSLINMLTGSKKLAMTSATPGKTKLVNHFRINGSGNRIPGSLSLSFKDADGEILLHRLDLMGTAVATGSACDSKETVLSHVIQAIAVPQEYAHGTIRVTLGMDNTPEHVDRIALQIATILR